MKRLLATAAALLLLVGCGTRPLDSSRVEVLLTDAPADEADQLMVAFGRVDLVPSDAEDEAGVHTVTDSAGELDVLELRNGEAELLGGVDVPPGTYDQIRLVVESARLEFDGGAESFDVKTPSGAQSGLKINVDPPLLAEAGATSEIVIDFDVSRAVVETPPGSGNYLLKPTGLRAVTTSGVLEGTVIDDVTAEPVEDATVTVYEPDETEITSAATTTEADGSFRIITLVEGTYDMELAADGYAALQIEEIDIRAGETTDLGTLQLTPDE